MAILTIQACATRSSPGRLIRRVDKVMAGLVEARFEGAGISFVQWIALKVVRDSVVQTAGELARELSITTGATTRMIDVLEAKGFVMRDRGSILHPPGQLDILVTIHPSALLRIREADKKERSRLAFIRDLENIRSFLRH